MIAVLLACKAGIYEQVSPLLPAPAVKDYVAFYTDLNIEETTIFADGAQEQLVYAVHRTPIEGGWREETKFISGPGMGIDSVAEYFLNDALGYGYRSWGTPGDEEVYTNPKVIVPANLATRSWEGFHGTSKGTTRRICKMEMASPSCSDGLSVTCQSWMPGGKIVLLRENFCHYTGWVGSEGRVLEPLTDGCRVVMDSRYTLKAVEGVPVETLVGDAVVWPEPIEGCPLMTREP